jgi:hypothetical protein
MLYFFFKYNHISSKATMKEKTTQHKNTTTKNNNKKPHTHDATTLILCTKSGYNVGLERIRRT